MTILGEILKERGILQKDFAKKTGIRPEEISYFVNNKRQMRYHHMLTISKALGCSIEELLEEKEVSTGE